MCIFTIILSCSLLHFPLFSLLLFLLSSMMTALVAYDAYLFNALVLHGWFKHTLSLRSQLGSMYSKLYTSMLDHVDG